MLVNLFIKYTYKMKFRTSGVLNLLMSANGSNTSDKQSCFYIIRKFFVIVLQVWLEFGNFWFT